MAGKAEQRIDERNQARDLRTRGIEAGFHEPLGQRLPVVPPRERFGETVDLAGIEAQRFADIAQRALRAIADDRRSECCAVAAVLLVNICLLYTSDAADERSSVDLG